MKKIISFSLWGNNPTYTVGAIKNVELAKKLMPDWICRFYVDNTVPDEIIYKLKNSGAEIYKYNIKGDWFSMFWRFLPASDNDVECMISRDCDSRISKRELLAVEEWMKSNKLFHIMRDHPYHNVSILGGMWGVKSPLLKDMKKIIKEYNIGNYWQTDQEFLRDIIYPMVKDLSMVHDSFFEDSRFPAEREEISFVGQAFDQFDRPLYPEHLQLIEAKELKYDQHELWWQKNLGNKYFCDNNEFFVPSEEGFMSWMGDPQADDRKQVRKLIPLNVKTFLDIGCGAGPEYYGLKEERPDIEYFGIDITPRLVKYCQEKGINVKLGTAKNISYDDSSFDVVHARHVLEHMDGFEAAIAEFIRVAKKMVIIPFFIEPTNLAESLITNIEGQENPCYNNCYSKNKIENFILSNKKVSNYKWIDLPEKSKTALVIELK